MKCPFCGNNDSKVVDSRSTDSAIRRRRECSNCLKRYTTYEKVDNIPILVIKKDQNREYFDKNKVINGLIKACQKRPVSRMQIDLIADEVERNLCNSMVSEVKSEFIGELIMDKLKDVDDVSYVRFASVYRQFKDVNTFIEEIKKLISKKESPNLE
ncbi:transcriptional regulator NrdR [Clostridium sp. DL1XJH146]